MKVFLALFLSLFLVGQASAALINIKKIRTSGGGPNGYGSASTKIVSVPLIYNRVEVTCTGSGHEQCGISYGENYGGNINDATVNSLADYAYSQLSQGVLGGTYYEGDYMVTWSGTD
ncbi:MAG: hypothetical protein M3Q97_11155, partial [Bacteroidota bacterium]|nr:hypothetical protein [Bacteroidota bacterium]